MKSEHRHELKTNELAEWISNLPQWAQENLRTIIYISVVAVLVIGSSFWYLHKGAAETARRYLEFTNLVGRLSQNKLQILMSQPRGVDASYMLIDTAGALQTTAESARNDQMAAMALIKRAEALRTGLHYRQITMNQSEVQTAINGAKAAYVKALEKASTNPTVKAMAEFGLGLCEEELGNFDQARQIYRNIVANSDYEGTTTVAKAKLRLETMADYQQRVVFRAAPKPQLPPSEFYEPPIPLRPLDVDLLPKAPNEVVMVRDVNLNNEPNLAPESLKVDIQPSSPNDVPGVADTNVPGE
jgi:tetratricopeptide (TPR) repeat protein